jgi:hypothetical protein
VVSLRDLPIVISLHYHGRVQLYAESLVWDNCTVYLTFSHIHREKKKVKVNNYTAVLCLSTCAIHISRTWKLVLRLREHPHVTYSNKREASPVLLEYLQQKPCRAWGAARRTARTVKTTATHHCSGPRGCRAVPGCRRSYCGAYGRRGGHNVKSLSAPRGL